MGGVHRPSPTVPYRQKCSTIIERSGVILSRTGRRVTNLSGTGEVIDTLAGFESWYARDNGRYLLDATRAATGEILDTAFGYHLLQTGSTRGHPLFTRSPINHRIYTSERAGRDISLVALADELPLESDSVDVVIAHHTLDFAEDPHQVLREMQRVLTPQGQLLVIGFNPHSLQGLSTRLRGLNHKSFWHWHRPVSEHRVSDWLNLLGCEVQDTVWLGGIPLFGKGVVRRWLTKANEWTNRHKLPSGSLYILHAVKHVSAVHRPQPQWQIRRQRLMGLVPKPAASPSPTPRRPTGAGAAGRNSAEEGGA